MAQAKRTRRKSKAKAANAPELDHYQRVIDARRAIAGAAGVLAAFGERFGWERLTLAGRVLEALNRVLDEPGAAVDRKLLKVADKLLAELPADRRELATPRPGDKAPIAEACRAAVLQGLEDGASPSELALILQASAALQLGGERVFGQPRRDVDRAKLWEPLIAKVLNTKDFRGSRMAAEIVKVCAKASGYRARPSDLFPDG
jgi:hypothetical protein